MSGIIFENFYRAGGYSLRALKRLYADHGLLEDEDADLELIKIDTVEEMAELLSGPSTRIIARYDLPAEQSGDMRL